MKDALTCRDYRPGDEHRVVGLFRQVFARELNLAVWKWRFAESPFGEAIIKLAFDGEKLVGHYAVIPMSVQVGNKPVKAGLAVGAMTHPAYTGQGVFAHLADEMYGACRDAELRFVYGFPNSNIYGIHVRRHGWKGCGKMSMLQKSLGIRLGGALKGEGVWEIDRFGSEVDSLWDKLGHTHQVVIPRTKDFLNWRFAEHPTAEYAKAIARNHNHDMLGYIALKVYTKGDSIRGHIIDMLCVNEKDTVKALLSYSYDYFAGRGVSDISCWMPGHSFYARVLGEEGFVRQETETYFGVKIFDESYRAVGHLSAWYLTMGDSDVF